MKRALDQFSTSLVGARDLVGLAKSVQGITSNVVDTTDCLRAALVLAVSSLDYFVHEFVRLGMIEVQHGKRPPTDAHLAFKIPLAAARDGIADPSRVEWLDSTVRETHLSMSFQHPERIADAIRLVSSVRLWEEIGRELGITASAAKAQLGSIVDRRNKIAHEADMDPTNPGNKWPIDDVLTTQAIDYIYRVAQAISKVA